MDVNACLRDVVGITKKECECFPAPEGEDAIVPALSLSGYYVDEEEEGVPLIFPSSAKDCGDDNVYDVISRARDTAIQEFITDLGATLQEFTLPRYPEILSTVGEIEKNNNVPLAIAMGDKVGVLIQSRRIRGATITIDRIRIRAEGDLVDAVLSIKSSEDSYVADVIDAITFSAPSGVLTTIELETPIVLPLTDEFGNEIDYAIVYDRQSSEPFNYQLTCGCSTKPKPLWHKYVDVVGLSVDEFIEIESYNKTHNRSYGLILDTRSTCKSLDWLCRNSVEQWKSLPFFRVVAKTLQLMTINATIGIILNSAKLNRYTLVKTEFLYGKRNHNRKEIADRLSWLAQSIPADVVDCYQCKASNRITKGPILV